MVYPRQEFDLSVNRSDKLTQLSPSTSYYLRKLLRHNLDRLEPVAKRDSAFDPLSNLNAVLAERYSDAPQQARSLDQLERLTQYHQTLATQGAQHIQQLMETEAQIFSLLGYRLQKSTTNGTVLIIDNTPQDISVLTQALTLQTYRVLHSQNADEAMAIVQQACPDLIFLDVLIARINGYELCKQIKQDPETDHIPIIFTSPLNDAQSKVDAFAAGGDDFIAKPFQIEEVLVRAKHQLQLRDLQLRLGEQNIRLQSQLQANEALETRYRSIIENSIDGIFQSTADGKYISVNPALAKIYGYDSPEELMQKVTNIGTQLYVHPARHDELTAYLKQHSKIKGAVSHVYRQDGSEIWISESVRSVTDSWNQVLYYEGTVRDVTARRRMESDLRHQRQEIERLLASLLPVSVADRLRDRHQMIVDPVEQATVLVADIHGFTQLSRRLDPAALLKLMARLFTSFDDLVERAGLETVKTVRDVYIVAGGVHTPKPDHATACAQLALDMQTTAAAIQQELKYPFQLRIGISTGSVIASVMGLKKITYDLWGDSVNLASRMQSSALPGKIQIAPTMAAQLADQFILEPRGKTYVLGIGEIEPYWLLERRFE